MPRDDRQPLYPISLLIGGQRCLVVGGGQVARRKVQGLLECGARVVVVSPELEPGLAKIKAAGEIRHIAGEFQPSQLEGMLLVIAATDSAEVNRAVSQAAQERSLLVNVVDDPGLCNFFVPAVLRRGLVAVAVSTGGESPALSRRLRRELEQVVGPEYGELSALLGDLRQEVKAALPSEEDRRQAWNRILDSQALKLLRAGHRRQALAEARACISSPSE